MVNYKLLTPGPLTTTDSVKREMMADHCTWDEDYKQVTQKMINCLSLPMAPMENAWVILQNMQKLIM